MATTKRTAAQENRQLARGARTGRYTKHNPCECCGKSAGYDYCSLPWVDQAPFHGTGLVLCEKCAKRLEAEGPARAWQILTAKKEG